MNSTTQQEDRTQLTLRLLEECALFERWSGGDKQRLAESASWFELAPGEALYERHDVPKGMYLIYSGSVKLIVMNAQGNEGILDVLAQGQWFGELSIVDRLRRQHTAIALEPTRYVCYDTALIRQVLDADPALYREFSLLLCERLRKIFNLVEEALLNSVQAQIYGRLRNIALGIGTPLDDGMVIRTRISQDMLAAMQGITRQTLNRVLGELKQQGVVKKVGGYYWVKSGF